MSSRIDARGDPLKRCPKGCIFEATRRFCPWHGEPLGSLIGTQVAEVYVIKRLVSASGGFGVVYYAETELGFEAAVKVLRPPACYEERAVNDFVGEARKALQLEGCPNTVGVLVCGVKPFPFIVMTYVSGGPLSERIRKVREEVQSGNGNAVKARAKKIPIDFAYRVLVDIASALKVAHEKGIVHRDLKPGNALIRRDTGGRETVLVSDWGIAIARREGGKAGPSDAADMTLVPTRVLPRPGLPPQATLPPVTINRAPPEFFKGNIDELYRPTADIYQFGIVAYEVLTGEFPFSWPDSTLPPEESWEFWRRQHCRVDGAGPVPLKQYRSDLVRRWNPISTRRSRMAKVVARCLDERPTRRYADGGKLLTALTEVPTGEKVARYAAAPLLLLVAFIVFLRFVVGSAGSLTNFFDQRRWDGETQTQGILAGAKPDAVLVDRDKYPVWRVWARSFSDLETRGGEPLVFTTYSLGTEQGLGKLESVTVERWEASGPEAETLRTTAPIRKTATLEGFATPDGNAVSLRLGDLAALLARERGSDAQGVFTFSVRTSFEERRTPLLSFFQIVIDPRPPTCEIQQVALAARGSPYDRKAYRPDALKAQDAKPPRLYAPNPYEDLECIVAANDDLDDAPAVKVRLLEGMKIIREREVKPGEAFRWFENGGTPPEAVATGAMLKIEAWAMDRAGMTRGEKEFAPETTRTCAFILDSGPLVKAKENRVIKGPGAAVLPVSVTAEDPASLRVYWAIDGDTAPPSQLEASSFEDGSIRIPLTGDAPGKLAGGGSIILYSLEGDLVYPGFKGPPGEKDWMELVASAGETAKFDAEPEAKIDAATFQVKLDIEDSFVKDRLLRLYDSAFEWRTNEPDRYPKRLILEAASRKDLNLDAVQWKVGGRTVKQGNVFEPPRPDGPAVLLLGIDVQSNWGSKGTLSARIEYDEKIPLLEAVEVVEGNDPPRAAFTDGNVLHLRKPRKLGFWMVPAATRVELSSCRLAGFPRPGAATSLVFRPQPEKDRIFFDLESTDNEVPEGIYELRFTGMDAFESALEERRYLYVHGEKPEITPCEGERPLNLSAAQGACSVRVEVSDPSGLQEVMLELDGKETLEIVKEGKLTKSEDFNTKVLREQSWDSRTPTILSLTADIPIAAGTSRTVAVKALDHPVGLAAEGGRGPAYNTECRTTATCGDEELPAEVTWLDLEWVLIRGARKEESFYITRWEIPVWFWKGKGEAGRPEDDDYKSWAPQTGETAASIDDQLQKSDLLREVYLPTIDEWKRIALGPDRKGAFIGQPRSRSIGEIQPASFKDRPEVAPLASIVNSSADPFKAARFGLRRLVPVNFRPDGLEKSGFFYGLYHFLGNVEEIIRLPDKKYGAAGGRASRTLEGICTQPRGYIEIGPEDTDRDGLRGFRLVVYPSAPAAKNAGEDRAASKDFGTVLRKAPLEPPKDAREAPTGSGGK